jgi:tRNA threonylcarbamoyladenosine biosynthesis protein TsaE
MRELPRNALASAFVSHHTSHPDARARADRGLGMIKSLTIETFSEEQTIALGEAIGRVLLPEDAIYLTGDLGSGKTRLAKGIVSAAALVSAEEVVSPSFTLINRFNGAFPVYHADLYRIERDQVEDIGLEESLDLGGALIVEWGEKIQASPEAALRVTVHFTKDEYSRRIVFEWTDFGNWAARLPQAVSQWMG